MPDILNYLAIFGILIVLLASAIAALRYRGTQGERYSPLNHFVSELGELAVSDSARLFNAGLVIGGVLLIPFGFGLGWLLASILGWLGTLAGLVTALALAAVGLYPMDGLDRHALAAMTFFRAGLAMVFFYGLAVQFQPAGQIVIPKSANILSIAAFISYASFLTLTRPKHEEDPGAILDPDDEIERPQVWLLPVVEWILVFATVFWILGMALIA